MKLWHAPTGKLTRGHVLDVNLKPFVRALKDLDKQLYVTWNPKKLRGWGCWEIRRSPTMKTSIYVGSYQGAKIFQLYSLESRDFNHILDCAFLNYDVIRKLKEMDTWSNPDIIRGIEAREQAHLEATQAKAAEQLKYLIKHNKSAMHDFYEMVRSGIHPAQVLNSTKWVHE